VIDDLGAVLKERKDLGRWSVYAICDGHNGTSAAKFVRKNLPKALARLLPSDNPPSPKSEGKKTQSRRPD